MTCVNNEADRWLDGDGFFDNFLEIGQINRWIDECNPVVTKYSAGEHKDGTKTKFGNYYAEHCKKQF